MMKILIAEDDAVSRRVLEVALVRRGYEVIVTNNGAEALEVLQQDKAPPLAILDWMMPLMDGVEICRRVRAAVRASPTYIILLTAKSSMGEIVRGLQAGADDYLTKPFNRDELYARVQVGMRVVELQRNVAERVQQLERAEAELRTISLTDDLTGLCNRRGFLMHAEEHLKVGRRTGKEFLLLYADLDGLKQINDTHGHAEGSQAIVRTAEILRQTFRESDIVARLGGDEFTILAKDTSCETAERITTRLQEILQNHNAGRRRTYELSLSLGVLRVTPDVNATVEELMGQADRLMYEQKRSKRQTGGLIKMDVATVNWS
jgi:diguanylate cyclase (GGDEF)-like protein